MQAVASMGIVLSGGSIIDLDGTFFVQLAVFFIAFFILKALVVGPVMQVLDAREAAITGARKEAAQMQAEVAEKKAAFETQLRKVREEGIKERDAQRVAAQKLARELTDKARREASTTLAEARTQMAREAEKARVEMRSQIPHLANDIASKLLSRSVN